MPNNTAPEDLVLTAAFSVTSADTDMYTRLRPGALVNFLIQASIRSADDLGYGLKGLRKHQLFWVLSRMTIEIYRPLKWYEDLEVETWAKDVEKLIYLRDYIVRDGTKEVVARGTSGWLAIDLTTKRPKKLVGVDAEIFERLRDRHGLDYPPERIAALQSGNRFDIHPSYFDFDLNKHVTATRYVDWMMDTFSFKFHQDHYPTRLIVNYMRETPPGEQVQLYKQQNGEKEYYFEGKHAGSGKGSFRGRVVF
jgi:acyl-ACP thioesterase